MGRGLLKEFPNPNRTGCPGSDVLKKIASHEMPLSEAEKWFDHLGSCSPCYSDFSQLRKAYELRKKRTLLAVAATILIAAGIGGWALLQKHNEALVAETVVLDLRNRSVARGAEPNVREQPLTISNAATQWEIYLPLGSSDGPYDIRVATATGNVIFTAKGIASLKDGITSLHIAVNLSSISSGQYVFQVRRSGSEWNSYPLLLH